MYNNGAMTALPSAGTGATASMVAMAGYTVLALILATIAVLFLLAGAFVMRRSG